MATANSMWILSKRFRFSKVLSQILNLALVTLSQACVWQWFVKERPKTGKRAVTWQQCSPADWSWDTHGLDRSTPSTWAHCMDQGKEFINRNGSHLLTVLAQGSLYLILSTLLFHMLQTVYFKITRAMQACLHPISPILAEPFHSCRRFHQCLAFIQLHLHVFPLLCFELWRLLSAVTIPGWHRGGYAGLPWPMMLSTHLNASVLWDVLAGFRIWTQNFVPRTSGSGNSPRDEREEYIVPSGKAVLFLKNCVGLT